MLFRSRENGNDKADFRRSDGKPFDDVRQGRYDAGYAKDRHQRHAEDELQILVEIYFLQTEFRLDCGIEQHVVSVDGFGEGDRADNATDLVGAFALDLFQFT